ncbi:hypothetical protein HYH03_014347 [Edaphochlamys debaryana]|uniref:Uncharacterized protein n=1 Tax=Edaphochlamys debaryana TaxID=47281 RepID=A0A835XNU8_9CHLO|nr:hypothetical protein HYH03_014347 [Edaphochlamys debaryana]|eukprot:KAG2486974.1 hypothetical protein HYH03_014347 [Edaphochlamys debaryana]
MAAPFVPDQPNPFDVLGSEAPAADNIATASAQGGSSEARAGEVLPPDVAELTAGGGSSLSAEADTPIPVANDSPINATAAVIGGAEAEDRARQEGGGGGADVSQTAAASGGGGGGAEGEGFQDVTGGTGAGKRAAEALGLGSVPKAADEPAATAASGGVETEEEMTEGHEKGSGGGGGGLKGLIGSAVQAVTSGVAALGRSGRDESDKPQQEA